MRSQITNVRTNNTIEAIQSSQEPLFTHQFCAATAGSVLWFNCIKSGMKPRRRSATAPTARRTADHLRLTTLLVSRDIFSFFGSAVVVSVGGFSFAVARGAVSPIPVASATSVVSPDCIGGLTGLIGCCKHSRLDNLNRLGDRSGCGSAIRRYNNIRCESSPLCYLRLGANSVISVGRTSVTSDVGAASSVASGKSSTIASCADVASATAASCAGAVSGSLILSGLRVSSRRNTDGPAGRRPGMNVASRPASTNAKKSTSQLIIDVSVGSKFDVETREKARARWLSPIRPVLTEVAPRTLRTPHRQRRVPIY